MAATFAPASRKQQMVLESTAQILIMGGAAGCLSKDHEILTPSGWVNISDWSGEEILQYDRHSGEAFFRKPEDYIKLPCDKLTRVVGEGISQELSDEHTVIYKPTPLCNPETIKFNNLMAKHNSKIEGWRGVFITDFRYSGKGIDVSDDELRSRVALMLSVAHHRESGEKLKSVINDLLDSYYNLSNYQLHTILDEILIQNSEKGASCPLVGVNLLLDNKLYADFIQFVAASQGYDATIEENISGDNRYYSVNITPEVLAHRSLVGGDKKATLEEFTPVDGFKYCFTTSTGFFVTRHNGCVVITGNSGKSYLLQLMPLLIIDDPNTACIMFRRSSPQLRGQGGLFEQAKNIYNKLPKSIRPKIKENAMIAKFPNGATVKWQSMQHVKDKEDVQGLQFTFIGVDEGCLFEWEQLEFMMSRLRSESKYPSRMVISCNPDPDHKIREMIDWYLDDEGYPIPERDGVIRWFVTINDNYIWADSKEELIKKFGKKSKPRSFSFISSTIYDNPPMLINNPEYLSNLEGLNEVDRARFLHGNWDARPEGSNYFKRSFLKEVDCIPMGSTKVRAYDKAGTERSTGNKAPDFTAGIGVARDNDGFYYLFGDYHEDFIDSGEWSTGTEGRFCKKAGERDNIITKQAEHDGDDTTIIFSVDPGQAGISEFTTSSRELVSRGYIVEKDPTPGNKSKLTRFSPFAQLAQNGFVRIVKKSFSVETYNALMKELESFNGERSTASRKDDWADATASGINFLEKKKVVRAVPIPRHFSPTIYSRYHK